LFVIAADRDPAAPGFEYADRRAIVSTEDEPSLERLAAAERVDGVISPGSDWPVAIAARIAEQLGLVHPLSAEAAVLATSKFRQRERLAEAGVPQPRWQLVSVNGHVPRGTVRGQTPDVARIAESIGFPCVVKAPDRQGQRGLSLVRSAEELAPALEAALAASRGNSCLVEELVEGPEVTVNAFSVDGTFRALTVTDRHVADPPAFGVALAHGWPARENAEAVAVAGRAAGALGIADGPTYTQLRLGPDGPQVVEVAARLGGGHDAELCHAALGVDLNGLALAGALGEPIAAEALEPRPQAGGACTLFLVAPEGELVGVEGAEEARSSPGVVDVRLYRQPGHRFGPLRVGSDRAGAVLAVGTNAEDALERARRAADLIRFETADAEALV
jgi:biotin carboxylase